MKILILANDDEGLFQFRKELIQRMLEEGNIVYATVPEGPYHQDLVNLGVQLRIIQFKRHGVNPFNDFKLLFLYAKLIKDIRPAVVLTYTIKPNVYGGMVCQYFRIPYITNVTGLGTAVEKKGLMQLLTVFLYRIGLRKAKMVFLQNASNTEFMLQHKVIKSNYGLIPGSGVNLNHFNKMDYPNDDVVVFSFISRIMKEKGIDQYLEAAKYIHSKYPKTQFHICGYCEEDYNDTLKNMVEQGIIVYHGNLRDVREMHKVSHCTIHPTYYPEGMSNVLLESLSCCRPIITTDRSGCREIVEDEVNGYIVKQRDAQDLIDKIERFLALSYDEKAKMGLNGREKVEKDFSRQIVVEKYMKEINSLKDEK